VQNNVKGGSYASVELFLLTRYKGESEFTLLREYKAF
jgi:hypothetical protein